MADLRIGILIPEKEWEKIIRERGSVKAAEEALDDAITHLFPARTEWSIGQQV